MSPIVTIGLEVHIALKSKYKAFSPEGINDTSWVSLGFPGTLPVLNLDAVEKALKLAIALNCRVNYKNIVFDRKNYFYYDLPKGYQLTQHFHPVGKGGHMFLESGKKIEIKQVHLEEDTAQQTKQGHDVRLFFNRLGRPLVEIVTEPVFSSYLEIEEFLKILRRICLFLKISDASYEKGEMRVDVNISVRKKGSDPLSKKSEIKNLNSLFSVKRAIDYIVEVQSNLLKEGKKFEGFTYAWVEKIKSCTVMRKKGESSDYFYIPEANIPKIVFSKNNYEKLFEESQVNLSMIKESLIARGLKDSEAEFLMDNHDVFGYVDKLSKKLDGNIKGAYNWIVNVSSGFLGNFDNFPYDEVEKVVLETEQGSKLNLRLSKLFLKEIIQNKQTFKNVHKNLRVSQISDDEQIKVWVTEALDKYQDQIPKLLENFPKLERLIIGACMQASKGQADPIKTKKIFEELIKKYKD